MRTDDPGTPGNSNWEVNLAATVDRQAREHVLETPLLDVNYGLGDRIQLKLELPWVTRSSDTAATKSGLGNSLLGVKWRFYENKKSGLQISAYPQFEFNNPTSSADRGLVDRGVRFLIPLEIAREFGPVDLNAELGYWVAQEQRNAWIAGLAVGHQTTKRLQVLGEIYATAMTNGESRETTFDLGGRYQLSKHLILLFMAGRTFRPSTPTEPQLIGYLGLQFLFSTRKHGRCKGTDP